MDLKLFAMTFGAIFLAEIGDKTNLATMSLAAGGSSRWMVFLGASLALIATSALSVLAGDLVARNIPPVWLKRGAGVVFLVLGIVYLLAREEGATPA